MIDSLAPDVVQPLLRSRFGHNYLYVERCASTQRLLPANAREGTVAVTEEQTEGRGRLGRRWLAPARTSILCSVVLRPPVEVSSWPRLSVVAGEACASAITEVAGVATEIKPPNDVLIGGRKVAGVLAEASEDRVVLGIGINVNMAPDQLPSDVQTSATSLLIEAGRRLDRAQLLAAVLAHLEERYLAWVYENG